MNIVGNNEVVETALELQQVLNIDPKEFFYLKGFIHGVLEKVENDVTQIVEVQV